MKPMKPEERYWSDGHSWRDINVLGASLFRIDWLDILGIGMVLFAIAVGVLAMALRPI